MVTLRGSLGFDCFQGGHRCIHDLQEFLTDGLDIAQSSLENGFQGAQTTDKFLHKAMERNDTGFPRNTSGCGTVERWR